MDIGITIETSFMAFRPTMRLGSDAFLSGLDYDGRPYCVEGHTSVGTIGMSIWKFAVMIA